MTAWPRWLPGGRKAASHARPTQSAKTPTTETEHINWMAVGLFAVIALPCLVILTPHALRLL